MILIATGVTTAVIYIMQPSTSNKLGKSDMKGKGILSFNAKIKNISLKWLVCPYLIFNKIDFNFDVDLFLISIIEESFKM